MLLLVRPAGSIQKRQLAAAWLLYAQDSPSAQGGRGLTRGLIFKPDGTLVASVAQEGSVRERRS